MRRNKTKRKDSSNGYFIAKHPTFQLSYCLHQNQDLLRQKIYQLIAGYNEDDAYNAHYGTVGFHPLVAFDGLTGDFLKAQLRPGNVYTSNGFVDFMRPLIEHYNETFPEASYLVRGDSGFAVPGLSDLREEESVFYIVIL